MIMSDANAIIIALFFSIAIFVFTAVSIALFVVYKILNRYNNFGDSAGHFDEYAVDGIKYRKSADNVLYEEKNELFLLYGENPYEGVERVVPEQLMKNAEKQRQDHLD